MPAVCKDKHGLHINDHKDEIFNGCVAGLHYEFERKFSYLIQNLLEVCMYWRSGISFSSWQYQMMCLWKWCLWHWNKLISKYRRKKADVRIVLSFSFSKAWCMEWCFTYDGRERNGQFIEEVSSNIIFWLLWNICNM